MSRVRTFCDIPLFGGYLEANREHEPCGGIERSLEFFPRAVPDQRQCRARFSISGGNLTIVLYEGSIFISTLLRGYYA